MMSAEFYKVAHVFGVFLLLCTLTGVALSRSDGGDPVEQKKRQKPLMMSHGIALVVILVGGFGLMARMGLMGAWPMWIWIKLAIWIVLAAIVGVIRRRSSRRAWVILLPLIATVAAWSAVFKPGS